ncbi:hypothetical protein [[Limnothrix rosea] IAM M-220]|uniref:hypothetical protein n=1 Tax=[Limnothrix rosea] IAM M-220 TaxID=454133 RepID=UPI00095BCE65|nr:hypothetical protein [[Limnothrix rosea] IAM M-220]OKH12019.1 hypothetical protein NIES208_16635 [[Limnothrix rosea] IAM M-220]
MEMLIRGNCGELGCEELWRSLSNRWSETFSQLESECPEVASYGFNSWENDGKTYAGLWCWQAKESGDRETYGNLFRVFPYPGEEDSFLAPTECGANPDCGSTWQTLMAAHPEVIREMQQTCALRQGFLLYSQLEKQEYQINCGFFAPSIQIDSDGDGIADGEGKPTGVDIALGILSLSSKP